MTQYCCSLMKQACEHIPETISINKTSDGYVISIPERGHLNGNFCLWCGKKS